MLLPSLFLAYAAADANATFIIKDTPCTWDATLKHVSRAYICLSFAKHFWSNAGINLILCDGMFTKTRGFCHIVLIAATFDGNNQVTILAFAVVDIKNAENWVWFKQ